MPKVAIITPVWADISQKVDWLDELIQSVVNQTLADWELLIIDDDSPIPLTAVRDKWNAEKRVRWFENDSNFGPAMTRNTAVGIAKLDGNPAILPLDADDVLANETVLEDMYDVWLMDQSKIIYGNLQQYLPIANSGKFERKKIYKMPEYSFDGEAGVMNLKGIIPVTAMHSIECWEAVGGWTSELVPGLEDVEYWIAAGKKGFCGHKIPITTFLYRRQDKSRTYELKHINQQFRAMQLKIKDMHSDVYQGRFPVGCCGKSGSVQANNAPTPMVAGSATGRITELEGYNERDKIWVEYNGPKTGNFSVLTRSPRHLPDQYNIFGKGHRFQIHKIHEQIFRNRQRLGFVVNVQDPRNQEQPQVQPKPQVIEQPRPVMAARKPQLSTIKQLDRSVSSDEIDVRPAKLENEIIIEPNPEPTMSNFIDNPQGYVDYNKIKPSLTVADLELSEKLTAVLEGLRIDYLASCTPEELAKYPGIGIKRAERIISKAQELINTT